MADLDTVSDGKNRIVFDATRIKAAKIRKVYDYWLGKHHGPDMPHALDIDILDLDFAIGTISFIDVFDSSPRFKLRMVGSQVVIRRGRDNTGVPVDKIADKKVRNLLQGAYDHVYAQREPLWALHKTRPEQKYVEYECLILPLVNKSGQIVQMMSVVEWLDVEADSLLP